MKKTVVLFLAVLMAVTFCACRSSNAGNSSMNSGMESGSGIDSSMAESSGSLGSDIVSGVDDVVSGVEDVLMSYLVQASSIRCLDWTISAAPMKMQALPLRTEPMATVKKHLPLKMENMTMRPATRYVTYDTAEEAQKECDKINSEGKKTAYTRGNALLIGEKDYEHHDEYSKPFQEYKK